MDVLRLNRPSRPPSMPSPQVYRGFVRKLVVGIDVGTTFSGVSYAVLDPGAYRDLRREGSATRTCFGLLEYTLGIDLPDDVFKNETFQTMYWAAVDMVCWANVSRPLRCLDVQPLILCVHT